MAVVQIGARLVRAFGKGKNLRKVVTEAVNGKTYTRVLDAEGNILRNRLKMIERTNVGNKKVSTITKVDEIPGKKLGAIKKTTYDRVYSSEGALLGSRCKFEEQIGEKFQKVAVSKQGNSPLREKKRYFREKLFQKFAFSELPGRNHGTWFSSAEVKYNRKGLPCPKGLHFANDMSLKQMRDWHFAHHPERPYAHPDLKLGFLDNRAGDNTLGLMNDLDKYI